MEKLIIIGAGVAGWTAAIYAGRANLNPLIFTGIEEGGQLMLTTEVENFPGFSEGINGPELMVQLKKQAEKFGTKVIQKNVTGFKKIKNGYEVLVGKERYSAKTIIISTGASARWLGLENEKNFQGRGLHTCATCDGFFYKGKEILVVGGGDSAMEESNFLTKFAKKVTIVYRKENFRASKIMQEKVKKNSKIEIMFNSEIVNFLGEPPLKKVIIKNNKTGEEKEYDTDGVFLAVGHIPNTKIFEDLIDLDGQGFVKTDGRTRTNLPGVFAAGDVQDPIYKQAITAAGTGAQAAIEAERYYDEISK
ncbi:thioredoxin-disulfide reductase [Candidatus Pacearchaeota archaeon CG10_big_fil_rev_8_21_14_0_10_32_42]|nr:MAG: thioredoxin-disulfide reductase [Candidatus Pacearchaeota archaeon CG10_big_fil_rev_8_21_14_0_10_32_42]